MASRIFFGKKYNDFTLLEPDLKLYEKENYVNLRKRDSCSIKTKKSMGKCLEYKDELVSHNTLYMCKHGGTYRSNNKTDARKTSTYKTSCPFTMRLHRHFSIRPRQSRC